MELVALRENKKNLKIKWFVLNESFKYFYNDVSVLHTVIFTLDFV